MCLVSDLRPAPTGFIAIGAEHTAVLSQLFERNADPDTCRRFDPFPLTLDTARAIAEEPRKDLYFASERDGALLGLTMLRGWDEGYEVPSFGILIDRAHRARGLGAWMTKLTIAQARHLGCRQLRLSVYASNAGAHALYERLGFREIDRSPAGDRDTKVLMTLELA